MIDRARRQSSMMKFQGYGVSSIYLLVVDHKKREIWDQALVQVERGTFE